MLKFNDPQFLQYCRTITNFIQNGVVVVNVQDEDNVRVAFVNDTALETIGMSEDEYRTGDPYNYVYSSDRKRASYALSLALSEGKASDTFRIITKGGGFSWTRANFQLFLYEEEKYLIITFTSVDELMGTQIRLQSEGNKWLDIVNSIPVGIAIFAIDHQQQVTTIAINDTLVSFANELGESLDGNTRQWTKEELTILLNHSIYAFCCEEDRSIVKQALEDSITQNIAVCVFRLRGSTDENPIFVKTSCFSKEVSGFVRNYYVTFENVTKDILQGIELEKNQDMLMDMSFHDALTHVKNRNAYNIMLENCSRIHLRNVGLAFADINGLKKVNDLLGHKYGDKMIYKFGEILTEFFDVDRIFRISGDEFIVIYPGIGQKEFLMTMENLCDVVKENNDIASVGYIWEEDIADLKQQLYRAEQIMYVEKHHFYENATSLNSKHRPILLNELISDFENDRFKMYLQPKADIKTSKLVGAEALVRKIDADGKMVLPYEFVPLLEKEMLIPKVDYFMLGKVCEYLEKMKKEGKQNCKISVNMSRITLMENNYIETVESIINKYDFNIEQLEFEITESNETMNNHRMQDYIKKINSLGIGISLDDVGTDYSSLPMLLMGGIDTVKLDRSLIIQIKNKKAYMLLKHVTDMCHDFDMNVIAEGVETDEIRAELESLNCDFYQGYLLSKPISSEEFWETFL